MKFKNEPLECPFCGEKPKVEPWHGGAKTKRAVNCDNDNCHVQPMVTGNTRKVAVDRWNTRL